MLPGNVTNRCEVPSVRTDFIVVYSVYGFFYAFLMIFAIISLKKAKDRNIQFTFDVKVSRYFIVFMLFSKTVIQFINAIEKATKPIKHLSFFLTVFPGYIVDISFFLILLTWCNLFLSFVSKKMYCPLKTIRVISIVGIPVSITVFFLSYFVTISSAEKNTKVFMRSFENYFALTMDLFLAIMFFSFMAIMMCTMDVKLSLRSFSVEQIVLWLCIASSFGLCVRNGARIYFQYQIDTIPNTIDIVCSVGQFVSFILRETFGQIIPFFFILFSDFFDNSHDVQLCLDQTDLLSSATN